MCLPGRAGAAAGWQKHPGKHARLYIGQLEEVRCLERGEVFTQLQLRYRLPGTVRADVMVKFYEAMPRVDFCLQLGKTLSSDIESVFLPPEFAFAGQQLVYPQGWRSLPPRCGSASGNLHGVLYVG